MAFVLKIRNMVISDKVARGGYSWASNELHAETSGRTLDGVMHIKRIGTKVQADVTCVALSESQAGEILLALEQDETFLCTIADPRYGTYTAQFYNAARNCEFLQACRGVNWWEHLKFTLIEC